MIDIKILKQYPLSFSLLEKWVEQKHTTSLALLLDKVTNEELVEFLDDELIYISTDIEIIGSDEWEFSYAINWLPIQHYNEKRRCGWFETKHSYIESGSSYTGAWRTRKEATEAAIQKAFELLEQKLKVN